MAGAKVLFFSSPAFSTGVGLLTASFFFDITMGDTVGFATVGICIIPTDGSIGVNAELDTSNFVAPAAVDAPTAVDAVSAFFFF